ncbi:tail fiber assembly protein [Burkholderia cenocepacia]|uniref:tail fiber assembly protein n=1 Tax=Burkholderia cenocepacia TaxID=95486 RepID=UPI0022EA2965|nr:tail fiber assembly protein [Burkholderia cenocepacia]MDA3668055.1 tail fiber assembly protein [Burkholderia cenocepacia]MDA3675235.1 tail fiber assembly protein [Burkholderia cenocepacia]MDA3683218.1 tail fiber assembly protein [Burkholderia cenocepacia]MDA3690067.1 tail fiber assembly protein [Burkholderia cenocepacia]MDA3697993.1 tail fiber assembly protein [Burkholderia cenocepacia]
MLCNQYDSLTGQYIVSFLADIDPMNSSRFLVPAFCTLEPLPERAPRTWPFWRNEKWEMLPDYRGVRLYRTESGAAAEITVAGVTPDEAGLTEKPRPSDTHVWRDGAWVVDEKIVADKAREAAMNDFFVRLENARQQNRGKSDARMTGRLTDLEEATFDAWADYQIALVRVVESPTFPAKIAWPAEPDPVAILAKVEATRAEKAAREAEEAKQRAAAEKQAEADRVAAEAEMQRRAEATATPDSGAEPDQPKASDTLAKK